ncbi:MAG: hypothetical protein IH984_16340 [Planctomycetes bacterium]|nr:hypothetical protein [Planctomycetota bacterium]
MRGITRLPGSLNSLVAGRGAARSLIAGRLIIIAITVCVLGVGQAKAYAESPFTITQKAIANVHHSPSVLNEVMASWSPSAFDAIDVGSSFDIPLPAGESVRAFIYNTGTTFGGANYWIGELIDSPGSSVLIVTRAGMLAGDIRDPEFGVFWLRPAGDDRPGEVRIQQVDPDAQFQCGVNAEFIAQQPKGQSYGGNPLLGTPTIDIIIFYTAQARDAAGGTLSIEVVAESHVLWSNMAYFNSNVNAELRLVKISEVDLTEGGSFNQILTDFSDNEIPMGPGEFGQTACQLDWYGADLASLFVANSDGSTVGLAFTLQDPDGDNAASFSVCVYDDPITFAHEVGHNLGCCHEHGNDCNSVFSYSKAHGSNSPFFRTVMWSSLSGAQIQNFSNPVVDYLGEPTGVPIGQSGEAHNAATINTTAGPVSQYRDETGPWSYQELAPPPSPVGNWGADIHIDAAGIAVGTGPIGGKFFGNCGNFGIQLPTNDGQFVRQVAKSGNTNIQSASNNVGTGQLQIFNGTILQATLFDPEPSAGDRMARWDIDIDGDVIVAGAGPAKNSVLIFRHNKTWEFETEINIPKGGNGGVAVHGDRVAVAITTIVDASSAEGVNVYRYNPASLQWELEQQMIRSTSIWVASDVDMDGDRIILSARTHFGGPNGATIYRLNPDAPDGLKWRWEAFIAQNILDNVRLNVGIDGNLAVIGHPFDTAVRVMEFDNDLQAWTVAPSILNPNPGGEFNKFGAAVAVHGSTIVASDTGSNRATWKFHRNPGISSAILPCDLSITSDPVDTAVEAGEDAIFSITASGFHEITYRWRKDGVQINDSNPDLYSGTSTPTMTVVSAHTEDQGNYEALVFFDGCLVASVPATLTITCTGDLNGSGNVSTSDLLELFAQWGTDGPADFDGSGIVDTADLLILFANWGPCN